MPLRDFNDLISARETIQGQGFLMRAKFEFRMIVITYFCPLCTQTRITTLG